jgi:hypothetical protein
MGSFEAWLDKSRHRQALKPRATWLVTLPS